MPDYNIGLNPLIDAKTGNVSVAGIGMTCQMKNPQDNKCYKLIKRMKGSQRVDVICKSFAEMPPKLELLQLKQEFINLGELGALNASIEDLSGSDFKVSFIHNGSLVEIYYELIMETEHNTTQYDPMI